MVLGKTGKAQNDFDVDFQSLLILGGPFLGKRETLHRLALDDIHNGNPVTFVGDASHILSKIPPERKRDVLYFSPTESSFSFNPFAGIPEELRPLYTSMYLTALKGIWGFDSNDSSTANMDLYLKGLINTALAVPGSSLISLKFLLTSARQRSEAVGKLHDPFIKSFWDDYECLTPKDRRQETNSTRNKLWAFMFDPVVRRCLDQRSNHLKFENKIVFINLDESLMGPENARLFGALILAQLYAESTQGLETNVYIENAYRYGSQLLAMLLSSPLQTVIVAQYLDQFSQSVLPAILGSADHIFSFCPSAKDGPQIEDMFYLDAGESLLYQGTRQARLSGGSGFLVDTFGDDYPITKQEKVIKKHSVSQYTQPIEKIEERFERLFV